MDPLDRLNRKELIELLGKCWMTHDGMWFYQCFLECGIEQANKINKAAIASLAPIEIKRVKRAMGIDKEPIKTFEEFKTFFSSAAELFIPDFMNSIWTFHDKNTLHWEFNERKCFAYNGISMIGAIDQYECGVLHRIECWLKSLNIQYSMTPEVDRCVVPTKGECSGDFTLFF